MATLLLQLIGPMQSWGTQSHFTHRDTGLEPSKSGVIGLLCAALGKPRNEADLANQNKPSLSSLAALRMGVRVDREGLVKRDYHTAKNVMKASGGPPKDTELSDRFYLADAAFLVGLEGDMGLLQVLHERLRRPVWMLFLGRKSFVLGEPAWLRDGLKPELSLEDVLLHPQYRYRAIATQQEGFDDKHVRVVIEDNDRGSIVRNDQPTTFNRKSLTQHCTARRVRIEFPSLQEGD